MAGQRRVAIGSAVAHVDLVAELVDDDAGAALVLLQRVLRNGRPAQGDRPMLHGFAFEHHAPVRDKARLVMHISGGHHGARVYNDADKIIVERNGLLRLAPVQQRHAGLCGNGQRHRIAHHQTMRTRELLLAQKQRAEGAQLGFFFERQRLQKRVFLQHLQPQGGRYLGHGARQCAQA